MQTLIDILSLRRGHCSEGEIELIEKYILPLNPTIWSGKPASYATTNIVSLPIVAAYTVQVDDTPVLWSCHTDTVHPLLGGTTQVVTYDTDLEIIWKEDGEPLGADDGAAVWLFLRMIAAKVPGTYIFHRGEEKGGIGSKIMAREHQDFLKKFTHAIAVDRKKTCSVITHQARGRCCSDKFAQHLGEMLSDADFLLEADDTGVYTDTAEYTGIIGECTNLSAGYTDEHTAKEMLDFRYIDWLRERLCSIDIHALLAVSHRKPGEVDSYDWPVGSYYANWSDKKHTYTPNYQLSHYLEDLHANSQPEEIVEYKLHQLEKWVKQENPYVIARLIQNLAYDLLDAQSLIHEYETQTLDTPLIEATA